MKVLLYVEELKAFFYLPQDTELPTQSNENYFMLSHSHVIIQNTKRHHSDSDLCCLSSSLNPATRQANISDGKLKLNLQCQA